MPEGSDPGLRAFVSSLRQADDDVEILINDVVVARILGAVTADVGYGVNVVPDEAGA